MLKKLLPLLLIQLCITAPILAQKNFEKDADAAFRNEAYYKASDLYKKAYPSVTKASDKARIIFQIGECYSLTNDPGNAIESYSAAIKEGYSDPTVHLQIGASYKKLGEYDKAIESYKEYQTILPKSTIGTEGVDGCNMAKKWKDNPTRYEVNPEVLLNSKQYDFSPTYTSSSYNSLYFISDRSEETSVSTNLAADKPLVYSSLKNKKGKWSEPTPVNGEHINSEHESKNITFNQKGTKLYFTRCPNEKNENLGCDIWYSTVNDDNWTAPTRVDLISKTEADTHLSAENPTLGKEDSYMIFSSDMAGGLGGKDLWISRYDLKTKSWGTPSNLGSDINTAGDDVFPVIRENGDLYFSSNGHPGMGGLDIFKATNVGNGEWSKVENLKSPLNSSYDDSQIMFEGSAENGLLISNRRGGKGQDDIYSFRLPPVLH